MTRFLLLFLLVATILRVHAQQVELDAFIRLPHVANYTFSTRTYTYSPAISTGLSLRSGSTFADVGVFSNSGSQYGYYVFVASSIRQKRIAENHVFVFNGFGEVSAFRTVTERRDYLPGYTIGVSPALVWSSPVSVFVVALTAGPSYAGKAVSVNARLVINWSIPLKKQG